MGRTVPTYRLLIDRLTVTLAPFRRALREQDRVAFDRVLVRIRERASAAGFLVEESPLESALIAALVGQERELQRIREEVAALRGGPRPQDLRLLVDPPEDPEPPAEVDPEREGPAVSVGHSGKSP